MSSQVKMLHLYGSTTDKDSMEAVASHKRHLHMNLHLYKRINFIMYSYTEQIIEEDGYRKTQLIFLYLM